MKRYIIIFFLPLIFACVAPKGNKLENDKARLEELKKQEGTLREKIETLQDSVNAEGGKVVKTIIVVSQPVMRKSFRHYVDVQAAVYGQDNINVSSEVPGIIKEINVTEGDRVTKGQVLALIDDAVLQGNIEEVQTSLDLAKTLYDKQKNLWDQKIGTEVQYLNAKSNYESQQKRLNSLKQQDELEKIKSPITGVVDAVKIKIGESVAPGIPAVQVVNDEQLKVKGQVAEAYVSDIHEGDSLRVFFPDLNQEISSTASYVSSSIDIVNRTFTVEVKLGQYPDYHPNMIALMRIIDYKNPSAIVIPINIVQSDPTGTFVFIEVKKGDIEIAKKQQVTVGKVYNGIAEITSGLNEGDELITIGYDDLNNGDAVSAEKNANHS